MSVELQHYTVEGKNGLHQALRYEPLAKFIEGSSVEPDSSEMREQLIDHLKGLFEAVSQNRETVKQLHHDTQGTEFIVLAPENTRKTGMKIFDLIIYVYGQNLRSEFKAGEIIDDADLSALQEDLKELFGVDKPIKFEGPNEQLKIVLGLNESDGGGLIKLLRGPDSSPRDKLSIYFGIKLPITIHSRVGAFSKDIGSVSTGLIIKESLLAIANGINKIE